VFLLQVKSRHEWRRALEEGHRDSQSVSLMVAGKPVGADGYPKDEHQRKLVAYESSGCHVFRSND